MATLRTVLPAASTALERAMDTTFPRGWDALTDAVEPGANHAALQPWLAQQWQVVQFLPYFQDIAGLLAEAVPWLVERGSAASVRRALGWLGYTDVTIDEDGAWLHLDVGQPLTPEALARVAHVVRASLPAHVHFFRVFHGYDVRPIVLDQGPALDAGFLDGYSGVPGGSGLVVSGGERRATVVPQALARPVQSAGTHARTSVARYDDMPVLDAWRLDSHLLAGVSAGFMELFVGSCDAPTPGAPQLRQGQALAGAAPWLATAPIGAGTASAVGAPPVPVQPAPRWAGPWGVAHGGAWEPVFWPIASEES